MTPNHLPTVGRLVAALFFSLVAAPALRAEVKPHGLFCDHAVLQRDAEVPVWGTARDGEKVTVEIAGQKATATAAGGKWSVRLRPMPAGGPHTLAIAGDNTVVLNDVMVGEVWVCSGQSNMERQLGLRNGQQPLDNYLAEAAAANYPQIRQFLVPQKTAASPHTEVESKWVPCDPESVLGFTAVGYFFGSDLHRRLKVPVGLIHSSWGGTPAQAWTPPDVLAREFPEVAEAQRKAVEGYEAALAKYRAAEPELLAKWEKAVEEAKQQGQPAPRKPAPPRDPATSTGRPSALYNAMIHPLLPYRIRGAIWYQGEADSGRAEQYKRLFPAMIGGWRKAWGAGEFPFLFVQIAPHERMSPEIREAQLLAWQTTPNTAMAVTADVGDAKDIHPTRKRPVGERLALAARALVYGEKVEYSGPVFDAMRVRGGRAELSFVHRGGGLVAKDGPLRGFELAGADGKFHPARAAVEGSAVVVSSEVVPAPKAVRYGWSSVPDVNLFNADGLPASPFRGEVR
jgi:sialate O-acetylesterase